MADIALGVLCLLAAASLAFTIVSAPGMGKDILYYRTIGGSWASGIYLPDTRVFYGPAPWTAVALSPVSLLSPPRAVIAMLVLNLAASAFILWAALDIWGWHWSIRARVLLCAMFLVWAPFRIVVRNGQLSLVVTALLLAFILARKSRRWFAAGALLGLSLIKYPLSFLFLAYTLWKREWKTAAVALSIPAALTLLYAVRLDLSPVTIGRDYISDITRNLVVKDTAFTGTTEIKPIVDHFLGGHPGLAIGATIVLWVGALVAFAIALARSRRWEDAHFAALSLFTLWIVFHRPYDSVLLIIPAAVLIDLLRQPSTKRLAQYGLVLLGLFALSIPGLLADRLKLDQETLSRNPLGFIGLHLERLIVLGLFSALLVLMIRLPSPSKTVDQQPHTSDDTPLSNKPA